MQRSAGLLRKVPLALGLCSLFVPVLIARQQIAGGTTAPPTPVAMEGSAAISGVVMDATTGQPLPGVMVYLGFQGRGAVGRLSRQISDDKGRFVFTDLPAGSSYFINASRSGYLDGHYGTGAGGQLGQMIVLTEGRWFADANVSMQRPAAISGTVVDERGEPAVGVFVRVLARIMVAGRLRLAAGQTTTTDDRGMYRLAALAPGRYVVQIPLVQQGISTALSAAELSGLTPEQIKSGRGRGGNVPPALDLDPSTRLVIGNYLTPPLANGRPQAYPPTFYPGVLTLAGAGSIDLKAGEERTAVDIALRPVAVSSISGGVEGPAEAITGLVVRLLPEGLEELGNGSEVATTALGSDGRFVLLNVPAGNYTIDVRRTLSELQYRSPLGIPMVPLPSAPGPLGGIGGGGSVLSGPSGASYATRTGRGNASYYVSTKVAVDARPLTNLSLPLKRGVSIRGRFVDEAGAPKGDSSPLYAEPADGNLALGMISARLPTPSTFEIDGLLGGEYILRFVGLGAASVVSIISDGQDYRTKPFDGSLGRDFDVVVTVSDKRTEVTGSVTDARGQFVMSAVVLAFPVDRQQWSNYGLTPARLRAAPISGSGTYRFAALPAGEYYLVAVPPDQRDAWQDPAKLAALVPSAVRLSLALGDMKTHPLTMKGIQ